MSNTSHFVICTDNRDYPASLERRKVYRFLHDPEAKKRSLLRVIDESGEDYLYPATLFVPIDVPKKAESAFADVA